MGFKRLLAVFVVTFLALASITQAQSRDGFYIIYDSSNSMWGALPDQSRKYEAARLAMQDLATRDLGDRDVALRMYGHRRKNDCSDSELVVPFSAPDQVSGQIIAAMQAARPTGRTPIDLSLRQALADFGDRSGAILLISDGIESCDADPCALVRAWRDKNVDITVHVVGLGLTGKDRAAMQCIADAAGTPYRDAFSASELIDTLGAAIQQSAQTTLTTQAATDQPPQPATPAPEPKATPPEFALVVSTPDGARHRGAGVLIPTTGDPIPVETFRRYTPEPGTYLLRAGIQTVGGEIYRPVETEITIAESGKTLGTILAERPPQVSATFSMEGTELRATVVTVFRDGQKLGSFKGDETAFVPEGTLEFRTRPANTSQDLTLSESFSAGDAKTLAFAAAAEVRLKIVAMMGDTRLLSKPNTVLMQDGVETDTINSNSGGLVTPGTYHVVMDDGLNRFETDITVSAAPDQVIDLTLPVGHLTVHYQDAAGRPEASKRLFLNRDGSNSGGLRYSGEPIALVPGIYTLTGWPRASGYPPQQITIRAGDQISVTLQASQ